MTTTLTPEQMRELAERVEEIARYCSNDNMWDEGEVADLRTAADFLDQCAEAEPVDVDALAQFIRRIDGSHSLGAGALAEQIVAWLAMHPAPQPQQADAPPLTCAHESIGEAGNVFDSRKREPQPEQIRGTGDYGAAIPGIERPCTCHPDDNPPVPCAQKYALNECKAAVREPTEAQIVAATDAWQAHCGLLLLSREGARDEVMIVLRAALAAKGK
jgi:hypothetical protein